MTGRITALLLLSAMLCGCQTTAESVPQSDVAAIEGDVPLPKPPPRTMASLRAAPEPAAARRQAARPPKPEAEDDDEPPLERHEASAQCWMKYDKSGGSLEARANLVGKCIDEKMRAAHARSQ